MKWSHFLNGRCFFSSFHATCPTTPRYHSLLLSLQSKRFYWTKQTSYYSKDNTIYDRVLEANWTLRKTVKIAADGRILSVPPIEKLLNIVKII